MENGYYETPKTDNSRPRQETLPARRTLKEHIRKAESKIVQAMAPYMMMYARVPETPFNKTKAAGATVGRENLETARHPSSRKNKKQLGKLRE